MITYCITECEADNKRKSYCKNIHLTLTDKVLYDSDINDNDLFQKIEVIQPHLTSEKDASDILE